MPYVLCDACHRVLNEEDGPTCADCLAVEDHIEYDPIESVDDVAIDLSATGSVLAAADDDYDAPAPSAPDPARRGLPPFFGFHN